MFRYDLKSIQFVILDQLKTKPKLISFIKNESKQMSNKEQKSINWCLFDLGSFFYGLKLDIFVFFLTFF